MQLPSTTGSAETWQIVSTVANIIGAVGVAVAAWAAWASTRVTRSVFEAAYRPYVGVESVSSSLDNSAGTLTTGPSIKNHGTVPADILTVGWTYRLNGEDLPQSQTEKNLPAIFPQKSIKPTAKLADARAVKAAIDGDKLEVLLVTRYKGAGKTVYRNEQVATLQMGSATMQLGSTRETEE